MKRRCTYRIIGVSFFLALCGSMHAASQLAPFYESLLKYRETGAIPPTVDLSKVVPSEEIPVIIGALNSGNAVLMDAAVLDARSILQIHINDGQPNFHRLQPPVAEVIEAFHALVPVLTTHFNDPQPPGGVNGTTDETEIKWKTHVVQFMDALGAAPTPDMLSWMIKVFQWPMDGGRAVQAEANLEASNKLSGALQPSQTARDAMIESTKRNEGSDSFRILPVLAHLNPMPASVMSILLAKIDDSTEPRLAESAITYLSENKSIDRSQFADRMAAKVLDNTAPENVREAARRAIDLLDVASAKARIAPAN